MTVMTCLECRTISNSPAPMPGAAERSADFRWRFLRLRRLRRGLVWFHWIRLPAWFVFVLWILFQIVGTLEQRAGMSSVSSAAHLGGAAAGVLAWLVWRKPNQESRLLE